MDAHLSIEIDKPDRIKGHVVVGDRTVDDEPFRCYEANTLGADLAERLWKRYGDYRIASMH